MSGDFGISMLQAALVGVAVWHATGSDAWGCVAFVTGLLLVSSVTRIVAAIRRAS